MELERDVSNLDEIAEKDLYIFAQVPDLKKKVGSLRLLELNWGTTEEQ